LFSGLHRSKKDEGFLQNSNRVLNACPRRNHHYEEVKEKYPKRFDKESEVTKGICNKLVET
jgi:hypothetical protein